MGTPVLFSWSCFGGLAPLWKTLLIVFGPSSSLKRISGTGLKGVMPSRTDNSNPTPNHSLLIMILQHRHQLGSGRVRPSSMEMKKRLARKAKLFCYQNKWLHRYREYQKYSSQRWTSIRSSLEKILGVLTIFAYAPILHDWWRIPWLHLFYHHYRVETLLTA